MRRRWIQGAANVEDLIRKNQLLSRLAMRSALIAIVAGLGAALLALGGCGSTGGGGTSGSGGARATGSGGAAAGSGGASVSGSGGTTASGSGGGPATGSGGATPGSGGGATVGSGGATAGSGGATAGTGGAATGSGGATTGSGGAATGSGGRSLGSGGGAGTGGATAGTGGATPSADMVFCAEQLASAAAHYTRFRQTYTNPMQIPRSASNGTPRLVATSDWTSGFPAGSFWLLYEHTREAAWRTAAETWTAALTGQRTRTDTHDVGFVINNSFGAGYRLTQNAAYRTVLLDAAASLATRFNATVGATRSWSFGSWMFPVIIDNMMNLELLFRASALGGDARFAQMASTHALTTRTNHFRADGSSYHLVDYNPTTGAVVRRQTEQGLADESAWARGQTWGLYGYTMSYRETRNAPFLDQAMRIADFYTRTPDIPADGVPFFDFDAPRRADVPDHRDASAAAIASSALLELARHAAGDAGTAYRAFAMKTLRSLSSSSYRAALGTNAQFLLLHSVGNYPDNEELDVALNYADYYYLEALLRCASTPSP
jgi:unsaturated chondroitin disaccharide hydrolase